MLQVIAGVQLFAGLVMIGGGILAVFRVIGGAGTNIEGLFVGGIAFIAISLVLFFTVANARLSDTFRAEEYRDRLRAVGLEDGERPEFVPEIGEDQEYTDTEEVPK
jgi:hypothetical protein